MRCPSYRLHPVRPSLAFLLQSTPFRAAQLWLEKAVSDMPSFRPAQEHLQRVRDIRKKRIEEDDESRGI